MKKLFLFALSSMALTASSLSYAIKAPLFGTVGNVNINYHSTATNYKVNVSLSTSGFAKKVTGDRKANYRSKGFISANRYKSTLFYDDTRYKNKRREHKYVFNYKKRKIYKTTKAWKDNKLTKDTKRTLPYFTYNDFFSAYHNIVATLKNKPSGVYQMQVAGMEKYGGYLKIIIPSKSQQKKEAKMLGAKGSWVFHLKTKRKILGSKSGELIFAVGSDGIAKVVRVLDVPFVSHLDAVLR